ncbi:MAG: ERAP1-like C-terminal domain-containing protein [Candidatus Eremiobacteraeota bacterium]|nr:ERAP1-like C-terminal domain-containing protein [Candidatus Eremiobacteraeota bacterium]
MLERWLGEDTFREGVRRYLKEHRFGNAEAADLWQALGAVSHQDVEAVLKSFTDQAGYPLLTFELKGKTLSLQQRRFVAAGVEPPPQLWTLPIFVRYGRGQQVARRAILLDSASTSLELEFEPEWLFPDDGGVGYYRWRLDSPGLRELVHLSPREKLAYLYNSRGLAKAGLISAGQRLAAAEPFLGDAHPAVVSNALADLDGLANLFVDDRNEADWRRYCQRLMAPLVTRYGLLPRPGEHPKVEELRPVLLVMLARYGGDPAVLEAAGRGTRAYLAGSDEVDPSLVDAYLEIALHDADVEMVDEVKEAMLKARDPQRRTTLLTALGLFGRAQAQEKAMDLMLDRAVTPSDLRTLLGTNSISEVRRRRLQAWIFAHFGALRGKIPTPFLASVVGSLSGARDRESLRQMLEFFGAQQDDSGVLKRELEKLRERVEARIAEREREQKSFDAALKP